jgi:hypothetical protein
MAYKQRQKKADAKRGIESSKYIYHVTETANVPLIKKKGLTVFNPTNWVMAKDQSRYGTGTDIYAFENIEDAMRWALKMDWEFNKGIGTGKISIITIKKTGDWEVDKADPLSQAGAKGKWLKHLGVIKPENVGETIPATHKRYKEIVKN